MKLYNDLRHEQARQIVDAEQIFSTYEAARKEIDARFAGSMSWKQINGTTYLYRKVKGANKSLGVRSEHTEASHRAFHEGRERVRERLRKLTKRLDEMAPVNRALGIGRVPATCARILRRIGAAGLMGDAIDVVGTNALFGYERLCGIQVESGLLATGDVDLLFDARSRLRLASHDVRSEGLLGLLRKVDGSFARLGRGSFRAVNDDGFMVDLIKPMPKDRMSASGRVRIGGEGDLEAIEIEGLAWLVNSPKRDVVVLDDRGYPLRISVPDPRSFAIHKAWLSSRDDRDAVKRKRDAGQARLVAEIVTERLPDLAFDGSDLSAMPMAMRQAAESLFQVRTKADDDSSRLEPDW